MLAAATAATAAVIAAVLVDEQQNDDDEQDPGAIVAAKQVSQTHTLCRLLSSLTVQTMSHPTRRLQRLIALLKKKENKRFH